MLPLIDTHCHLLAGLDDGPRTWEEAVAMCRLALEEEGVQLAAATAHQNETWPEVTPRLIREQTRELARRLGEAGLPLAVVPSAEVMASADMEAAFEEGQLLTVADRGQYLLVEMPHRTFLDLRGVVGRLRERHGLRVILAHPERQAEWLHEPGAIEEMIDLGCLVQVSAGSITRPASEADARALKDWFRRGCVHLLGSDGHSPGGRRAPRLAAAYEQVSQWAGTTAAVRVCSTNGLAVLRGLPLRVGPPERRRACWWRPWSLW